ncbi:hypothetical protein J2W56_005702 [Nocardia kruczakiae]|uniref:Uncharacterized protein n=1 Tax=Nocardia kruczakiae TaxID=261477 RepID=A0ABU1XPH8_9NOCA|nr:hypothetical protein [Nocardia kruczakiae]MDR7171941.1 hypothetical protein [Nocardia kruczakiae]
MNTGNWHVLVEEQVGASKDYRQWELSSIHPAGADRSDAERLAEELSRTYRPHHPLSPRRRTRYRTADGWVVVVDGAMSDFRFRLTIAERVPD